MSSAIARSDLDFLTNDSELSKMMLAHDWTLSALGAPATWPQSLRSVVGLLISSRYPMFVAWGSELSFLYNDAYSLILGAKHPKSLGLPFHEIWHEIWWDIHPLVLKALAGEATFHENLHLIMERNGYSEDTWYSFSYSPVRDESGAVAGMFCACTETTSQVLAERQLAAETKVQSFLLNLSDQTRSLASPTDIIKTTTRALGEHLSASRVVYAEVDDLANQATAHGDWTDGSIVHLPELIRLTDFGEALIAKLRSGGTLRVADVRDDAHTRGSLVALKAIEVQALVSVPLFKDNRFVVNLNVHQKHSREWTDAEVRLIEAVAERTWETIERARADVALRSSEAELNRLAETLPILIAYIDKDVRFRFVNTAYENWFGQSREDLLGQRVADVLGETAYSALKGKICRVRNGERVSYEQFIPHRKSAPRNIRVELLPRISSKGTVEGFYAQIQDITEEKRAESALRSSEARLAAIFSQAPVGLSEIDLTGKFTSANDELCKMLGRTCDELMFCNIEDVSYLDDTAVSLDHFHRAIETGLPVSFDKRYTRKNGSTFWANSNLTVLFDEESRPRGVLAVIVDLTERHAQAVALEEETRALETLNRAAAKLSGELDLDRLLQTVTDASVELTGAKFGAYFHNEMDESGERLHLYTLSGANRADFDNMGRPRATAIFGPTFRNESVIRSSDILLHPRYGKNAPHRGMPEGHLPVRSYLAIPVVSRSGEVHGGLIFGHPETGRFTEREERLMKGLAAQAAIAIDNAHLFAERRLAEARLRDLNDTLEEQITERTAERDRMWRLSTDLMLIASFDGSISAVNPAWTRLLGWSADELVGKSFLEFVHPDDLADTVAEASLLAEGRTTSKFANRYRCKDNGYRNLSWTAVPSDGLIHAVARDVTAEEKAAAELAAAQEALRQSQKMEAMGQLTGGVAHDFNNLLTPIVGSLDMLQRKAVGGDREQRLIAGALQSADRAKTLVQRLLAFARRQPLQSTLINVSSLVHGMTDLIRSTSGPQVNVIVDTPDDLPAAWADPNQLEMAILNLAVNARDAMPEGGTLSISARLDSIDLDHSTGLKPGRYICLSVADTGVGMDDVTLKRSIEPFFSTKGIGKGTGLGLSMVHGLASQLGGKIDISSKRGLGTQIAMWLPAGQALTNEATPGATTDIRRSGVGTVLLVDDEEIVRASTADMLMDLGYSVVEANSAAQALALLSNNSKIDVVITDHLMPGMTGVELASEIKIRWPIKPVLLISGFADVEGISPHLPRLTKPFRQTELAEMVAGLQSSPH